MLGMFDWTGCFWGIYVGGCTSLMSIIWKSFLSIWSVEKEWHRYASEEGWKLEKLGGTELPEGRKRTDVEMVTVFWISWDYFEYAL